MYRSQCMHHNRIAQIHRINLGMNARPFRHSVEHAIAHAIRQSECLGGIRIVDNRNFILHLCVCSSHSMYISFGQKAILKRSTADCMSNFIWIICFVRVFFCIQYICEHELEKKSASSQLFIQCQTFFRNYNTRKRPIEWIQCLWIDDERWHIRHTICCLHAKFYVAYDYEG